jgi:K+-sensing histidine kinase KdpD
MIDILVNTNKIKYSKKRLINVYRLFERLSKILRNSTERKNLQIHWHDNGRIPDSLLYPSFQFIPLVLLDNAIKYSHNDRTIEIGIYFQKEFIRIKVSSFGDFVPKDEEKRIFEKYYKGKNSYGHDGIGMGLWIAEQICKAHDGVIFYEKNGSGNFGQNVFIVEFPHVES